MTRNNLSFKSENLVVDWMSFNAKGLTDPQPIAKYLLEFGFNSFQLNSFQERPTRKEIFYNHPKNKFNVIFSRPIERILEWNYHKLFRSECYLLLPAYSTEIY